MRKAIKLHNIEINKALFNDIVFFSLAEEGALGEAGGVVFYKRTGQPFYFNYVLGDVDLKKVEKMFPVLAECEFYTYGFEEAKVPDGWTYVYLGMGNHLIVHNSVYPQFEQLLGDKENPDESELYKKWERIADKMLNIQTKSIYKNLIYFIDEFKSDSVGEWIIDNENDGTEEHPMQMPFVVYSPVVKAFMKTVFDFSKEHPEFNMNRYNDILEKYDYHNTEDVNKLDGQGVMALLMSFVYQDRFCEGLLGATIRNGTIEKLLLRLKELEQIKADRK